MIKYYISKLLKKIQISAVKDSHIHKTAKVGSASNLAEISLGRYSYIGSYCTVVRCEIGSFCSIADNCVIGGAAHPIYWVSTSPVFHKGRNILRKNISEHEFITTAKTMIGNDVWIGNNSMIKQGVIIGNGAIVGMGAVVTHNIPPYAIVAGNPAKIIKMRFSDDYIKKLENIAWWTMDENILLEKARLFSDIDGFIKTV